MWFKEFTDHESLIKPANEVKLLLAKVLLERRERTISVSKFSEIHYRYILNYLEIAPNTKLPTRAEGLRVLESDGQGTFAVHDLSLNGEKPRLFSTKFGASTISFLNNVISELKTMGFGESVGEIRHLSVPELNVESIWFSQNDGTTNDFFIRKPGTQKLERKTQDQFINYLVELKEERAKGEEGKGKSQGLVG